MDLAEYAQLDLAGVDLRAAAGVVGGVVGASLKADVFDAARLEDRLDAALEREEVHIVAVGAEGEELRLVGKAVGARQVDLAQLVEPHGLVAVVVVAGDDLQHGGEDGGAHDGGVLAQRVEDLERAAQRGVRRHTDLIVVGRADERVGDDLVVAEGAAGRAERAVEALRLRKAAARRFAAHERAGNVVVAVEAGDLLGDVAVMLHVAAPAGDENVVAVQFKAEGEENFAHQALGQVGAEEGVDLLRLELDDRGGLVLRDHVQHAVHDLAAAEQLDELAGALHGLHGVHRVEALFIARGGVRAHTEGRRRAADGHAVEVGALKEHHRRVADDLAVCAAHHARDAHGLVLVADAEHIGGQLAVVAVERLNDLALARSADDDPPALHAGEVEGVHRLAVFEHDVVRDVHDVVDRAHAGVAQPLAHPLRGGGDLHVFDHARGIARAERAVFDLDVHKVSDAAAAALDLGRMEFERALEGRARLAGEADDGKAVGAVGRDLELDDGVVVADDLRHIVAGLHALLLHDPQTVLDGVGNVVQRQAELLDGAAHSVGLHAAQLARVDLHAAGQQRAVERDGDEVADLLILRAGDDLNGLILPDVDLTDPHMVGIFMARHLDDAARDHVLQALVRTLDGLDLRAGERHFIVELLVGNVAEVHELIEPVSA